MKRTTEQEGTYAALEARPDVLPVAAIGDASSAGEACICGGA